MPAKVLVAYGTTNGSTARIAETIAEVLRKGGVPTEAVPAHSVMEVESYDAVVVGGGLYAGRWHKDARRFVRRHGRVLAGRPLWFFSSGPLDASATEKDIPPVPRSAAGHDPVRGPCARHVRGLPGGRGQGIRRPEDRFLREGWGLP